MKTTISSPSRWPVAALLLGCLLAAAPAQAAICDPPGPPPRFGCIWSTDVCDWLCAVCDPPGTAPRATCHWDTSLCNWICPGYTGVVVTVQTRRPPAATATVYVKLSSLCAATGEIAACQGQFPVGNGMSLAGKCQALADAVASSCSAAGYAVTANDCSASATFSASNVGCPRSQFALGISNDAATFDQSGQDSLPDGESETVTGVCTPVASMVAGVRVDKAGGGVDLLVSWDPSANSESYTVYEDGSAGGSFAEAAAQTGSTSATIPMPSGATFFLIAGGNWVCGAGSKE